MDIIKGSAGFDCSVGETGATPALVQFIGVFAPYSVKGKCGEKLRKEVRCPSAGLAIDDGWTRDRRRAVAASCYYVRLLVQPFALRTHVWLACRSLPYHLATPLHLCTPGLPER